MKNKETRHLSVNKNTPILVIGFGSIGQRHFRNLKLLGYKDIGVNDVNPKKLVNVDAEFVPKLTDKVFCRFPVVFVCNPSDLHMTTALRAAKMGCHLFIEKPLALEMRLIKKFDAFIKKNKLHVMIGCNYRFNEGFKLLQKKLQQKILGKPLWVNVAVGYDLRTARPGTSYKQTYAASLAQGGGVLIDSGAHVIDYLLSLFGEPSVAYVNRKNLLLDMDAEDFAVIELELPNNVFAMIELDYFSNPPHNFIEIRCEKGLIRWDVVKSEVVWITSHGTKKVKKLYHGMDATLRRNDMFIKEVIYFMEVLSGKKSPVSDLSHARKVVDILSKLSSSAKYHKLNKI